MFDFGLLLGFGISFLTGSTSVKDKLSGVTLWMNINLVVYLIGFLFYAYLLVSTCNQKDRDLRSFKIPELAVHGLKVVVAIWAIVEHTNSSNWNYVPAWKWK